MTETPTFPLATSMSPINKERCWYMWAWAGDQHMVAAALTGIRHNHPDDEVIVIGDGTLSQEWDGARVFQLDSPKWLYRGDNFLHERYELLLQLSEAQEFIKIDPDSEVHHPIRTPTADWFGQLFHHPLVGTAGCGMGLNRRAIASLLECPVEGTDFRYTTVDDRELMAEDPTLAYYLTKQGYSPTPWPQVRLGRVFRPDFIVDGWAITHPSIRKRMKDQCFKRIAIDPETPAPVIEALRQALIESGWQGAVYSEENLGDSLHGVLHHRPGGRAVPHPRMAHQVIRVDAQGLVWVGGFNLGEAGPGLILNWYSEPAAQYRIGMMRSHLIN